MNTPQAGIRARLALAVAARDTADHARALVGDIGAPLSAGDRIRAARRLRALALAVLDSAVLVELEAGASWAEIGAALGLSEGEAQRRYAETAELWLAGVDAPGLDLAVHGGLGETMHPDSDPDGLAEALNAWYARHAEPWEAPGPVAIL